jgi:hypothetical protein
MVVISNTRSRIDTQIVLIIYEVESLDVWGKVRVFERPPSGLVRHTLAYLLARLWASHLVMLVVSVQRHPLD